MTSTVYAVGKDHCLLKISLLISLTATKNVVVKTGLNQSDLESMANGAKSILLETPAGFVTQHVAILRYLANSSSVILSSEDEIETAQIDQWLEFSWQDLGKRMV